MFWAFCFLCYPVCLPAADPLEDVLLCRGFAGRSPRLQNIPPMCLQDHQLLQKCANNILWVVSFPYCRYMCRDYAGKIYKYTSRAVPDAQAYLIKHVVKTFTAHESVLRGLWSVTLQS